MGYVKWSYQVLEKFCYDAFRAFASLLARIVIPLRLRVR